MDRVYIPKKFFINMTKTHKSQKWINSELITVEDVKPFKGAMFDLRTTDLALLENIGLNDVVKKIYCYIDIEMNSTINVLGKKYTVVSIRDYDYTADLRIYYLRRVDKNG